ncbi:glycosyltransferase family 2 protein [Methanobacterium sp. CWC-01]|jgi:glycosyltransferase involved in cell wall biosynthesis|uniref:glycosyltransferase family 2 protein n=1 Tax=Methanobacterium aridiramus TaxID=2584467 RepID=UPI002575AD7F|nr:glycosyltransferase family 2 protein [Methanobacterium sp. CWC-01]
MNTKNFTDNQSIQSISFIKDVEEYSNTHNSQLTVSEVLNRDYTHSMKHVTFLLPAYNEEESIGTLLRDVRKCRKSRVLVIDNNSNDRTAEIAKKSGANVLRERKQGKGFAVKTGFENIKSEFAVMLDADNTYDPKDAQKLLKPLMEGEADVVLGSRLRGKREEGSISRFNLLGNHLLSFFASLLYSNVSDVCTGYWAFKKNVIEQLLQDGIDSDGFDIEAEMFSKVSKNNFRVLEVPIHYKSRLDATKLNSVNDGVKIFIRLFSNWVKMRRGSLR